VQQIQVQIVHHVMLGCSPLEGPPSAKAALVGSSQIKLLQFNASSVLLASFLSVVRLSAPSAVLVTSLARELQHARIALVGSMPQHLKHMRALIVLVASTQQQGQQNVLIVLQASL
jgi:hypothetical protein